MRYRSNRGQSLLETVVAIGILLLVVSAVMALTASNIIGQKSSELQIIANNLAREGIEAVRSIRDDNWLSGQTWDTGLIGSDTTAIASFNPLSGLWTIDFSAGSTQLFQTQQGVLVHDSTNTVGTIFSRELTIYPICLATDGTETVTEAVLCAGGQQRIGVKVIATVYWSQQGGARQVILEDLLYAWK